MRPVQSNPPANSHKHLSTNFPIVPLKDVPAPESFADTNPYRPIALVVDAEPAIADSLAEILNQNGYAAIAAYDAEGALETALLMPPDLIIADVGLPGMSGIELAITLKGDFPDCKILLFSGHASASELLASARRRGHEFEVLTKPVHPGD